MRYPASGMPVLAATDADLATIFAPPSLHPCSNRHAPS